MKKLLALMLGFSINNGVFWKVKMLPNAVYTLGYTNQKDDNSLYLFGDKELSFKKLSEKLKKKGKKFIWELIDEHDQRFNSLKDDIEYWCLCHFPLAKLKDNLKIIEAKTVKELQKFSEVLKIANGSSEYSDEYSEKNYELIRKTKKVRRFFIKLDDKIIGCFWVKTFGFIIFLDGFAIYEEYRNKGLGSQVLTLISKELKRKTFFFLTEEDIFNGFYLKTFKHTKVCLKVKYLKRCIY